MKLKEIERLVEESNNKTDSYNKILKKHIEKVAKEWFRSRQEIRNLYKNPEKL